MGVAQNCENMGAAKGQGGETAFPTYYLMDDMELCEGKNEDTSAKEIDMIVVTLPYQNLKAWQNCGLKERLEIGRRNRGWRNLR